jgi:hypothetical protein
MNKHILFDELPCWYELSWVAKPGPAILIRIREEILRSEYLKQFPRIMKLVGEHAKKLFACNLEKSFGFGKIRIRKTGNEQGFVNFEFRIPYLRSDPETCLSCGGLGKDSFEEWASCRACHGRKKTRGYDWAKGGDAVLTLGTFLQQLEFCDQEIASQHKQLFTLSTYFRTDTNLNNCPFGFEASPKLVGWLGSLPRNTELESCSQAMRLASEKMIGKAPRIDRFTMYIGSDGRLHANVPGNCACLGSTDFSALGDKAGATYNSHNVDGPWQQLSFVAGLAALHDMARKQGE